MCLTFSALRKGNIRENMHHVLRCMLRGQIQHSASPHAVFALLTRPSCNMCSVVWYTNCRPQNMTRSASKYGRAVQLHSTAFTRLFLPLWVGESGMHARLRIIHGLLYTCIHTSTFIPTHTNEPRCMYSMFLLYTCIHTVLLLTFGTKLIIVLRSCRL